MIMFEHPLWALLEEKWGLRHATFAQCHELVGGEYQKYTAVAFSRGWASTWEELDGCWCTCSAKHAAVAEGYSSEGISLTSLAEKYSGLLRKRLSKGIVGLSTESREGAKGSGVGGAAALGQGACEGCGAELRAAMAAWPE